MGSLLYYGLSMESSWVGLCTYTQMCVPEMTIVGISAPFDIIKSKE